MVPRAKALAAAPKTIDCPMHIQLQSILDQFDAAQNRLHRLTDGLTETRWAERVDPARWSVAECVAHLMGFRRIPTCL